MRINFSGPDDLGRAMEVGVKVHVFENQHYDVDAERSRITFYSESPEQAKNFVTALKHHNACCEKTNRKTICFTPAK
ncbi:MAG: hypothetical protein ACD_25C00260G0004 [uncultured bacterium]|nr:hypothetical protein P147_WWE3C00001G0105 [candidate division WWE3 bacterium RAAC2_WWE3_1]EKD94690.1 MAG: hypothetical protein ACD_25C00260G0004 [uncultured bacterium]KKS30164.1 MAG: hypothetical protein UU91_C0001G0054 [candidate division WWE3 bacterium GW2011_GWB1_42_117]KKS55212.1 MAG: hypothetical protein UV21_C0002G0086 [candidate division WWE3 bacterium GW2011_GWD2_42_34]KKT05764.1 MAG: hypothetical protein UV83_C0001G0082 [candidate division WWE3 bacterium GW2011_GWE2_43_18]KKT07346.